MAELLFYIKSNKKLRRKEIYEQPNSLHSSEDDLVDDSGNETKYGRAPLLYSLPSSEDDLVDDIATIKQSIEGSSPIQFTYLWGWFGRW